MQRLTVTRLSSLLRTSLSQPSNALLVGRCDATNARLRPFSSISERDDIALEEDVEKKAGWLLKLFFVGTFGVVGYQFFPYMDERRMKVVEFGGAVDLLTMLETAKDDKTRKEALKALLALSYSDVAAEALRRAGAVRIIRSTPGSSEHAEVEIYRSSLLRRFEAVSLPAEGVLA